MFGLRKPHQSRIFRQIALGFALIAISVRAAVPAGFMIAPTETGESAIVICTAQGLKTIAADMSVPALPAGALHDSGFDEQPADGDSPHKTSADAPCSFAAAQAHHGAPLAEIFVVLPFSSAGMLLPLPEAEQAASVFLSSASARAPPFIA